MADRNIIHAALQEVWREHPELRTFEEVEPALIERLSSGFLDGEASKSQPIQSAPYAMLGIDTVICEGIEAAQPNGSDWTPDYRERMDELLKEGRESIKERTRELVEA